MKLRDQVAIITGGGTGIGRSIAEIFASEGAKVVLAGRRWNILQEVQGNITSAGGTALAIKTDIRQEVEIKLLIDETIRQYGQLNILVNNAGALVMGSVTETSIEDWDRIFDLHVRSVFLLCRYALPEIERAGGGSILNISSTLGEQVIPACTAYCASKAALNMMTSSMALDYAAKGVRINSLSPGVVDTPIHEVRKIEDTVAWEKQVAKMHPIGRIGQPMDVARAALFLVSEEASWITGANLPVDGGIHLT